MMGAILTGGVIAPVLLMLGLARTSGSAAALLLNLEGVFTALLAWFVFHENVDRRIAVGFLWIAGGGVLLSWEDAPASGLPLGAFLVVAACLGWAVDNNMTQRVSGSDPVQVAGIKGLAAGCVNLALAGDIRTFTVTSVLSMPTHISTSMTNHGTAVSPTPMCMNMFPWSILVRTILSFITGTGIDGWAGWYVNRPGLPGGFTGRTVASEEVSTIPRACDRGLLDDG